MKKSKILWIFLTLIILGVVIFQNFTSQYDHDEVEHLHAAWLISDGQEPYVDFFEHHHPTLWYMVAPLTKTFENNPYMLIGIARCTQILCLFLIVYFVSLIIKNIYGAVDWKWSAILLVSTFMFTRNILEVRPDPWMTVFVFASIYFLFKFLDDYKKTSAFLFGLFMGIGFVLLQKALVVMAILGAAMLIIALINIKKIDVLKKLFVGALMFSVGFILPVIIILIPILLSIGFDDFIFWNYTFNKQLFLLTDSECQFSFTKYLFTSMAQSPSIWIFGVLGVLIGIIKLIKDRTSLGSMHYKIFILIFAALGYFAFFVRNKFPNQQYLIVLFPFLAILANELFNLLKGKRLLIAVRIFILLIVAEFIIITLFYGSNDKYLSVQNYILNNTSPADTIYASPPHHPISRRDAAFFWYNAKMVGDVVKKMKSPQATRALEIEKTRWNNSPPKIVFFKISEDKYAPFNWEDKKGNYRPTKIKGLFIIKK